LRQVAQGGGRRFAAALETRRQQACDHLPVPTGANGPLISIVD
jgi:hypothetical protein